MFISALPPYDRFVLQRWLSIRAIFLHLALVVLAPGCLLAGWWQATRAMSGNTLSYLYAIEWPAFAIIGGVMWWQLIHEDPVEIDARKQRRRESRRTDPPPPDRLVRHVELESDELRAYNDYLAELASRGGRRGWISSQGDS
jgi:hypothetical protein